MKNKFLLMTIAIMTIAYSTVGQVTGTFIDSRDSTTYKTVIIGTQTWMAENLNYASNDSWCYNDTSKCTTYGRFYTWEAAKKACPTGWHLPSDTEWSTLTTYLGGDDVAGGKLKSTSTWASPNIGATNSSGFTALPGGLTYNNGSFFGIKEDGYWWSSTIDGQWILHRSMSYDGSDVETIMDDNRSIGGLSVRCLMDL